MVILVDAIYVCKNKLVGRVIEECTSLINETMINNKVAIVAILIGIICFCVFAYSKRFKKYINY